MNNSFFDNFTLKVAADEASKQQAFELRHKVYCEELEFEPTTVESTETDAFDCNAVHILIQHKDSREFVACARAVMGKPGMKLPFQSLEKLKFDQSKIAEILRERSCEISRLAVAKNYRGQGLIPLVLYSALFSIVRLASIEHVFATMESRLARHIKRAGFDFELLSNTIDLHGERALFVCPVPEARDDEFAIYIDGLVKDQLAAAFLNQFFLGQTHDRHPRHLHDHRPIGLQHQPRSRHLQLSQSPPICG